MNIKELKQQKKIHFIGIGGIGMSALAFILRKWNIAVQGSDLRENYLTPKLKEVGVEYFVGHHENNLTDDVSLVVQTSIIKTNNPEILKAQKLGILIITRAQLLASIMQEYKGITIAGTHGKTSTTAMVSVMLETNNFDPTVINGGIIHYFQSNSKIGNGEYLVAESDESDASFINLPTTIGAVTNIEPEHLEYIGYNGDFNKQKQCFEKYITQIPDNGLAVLCIDSPEVMNIYNKIKPIKSNLVTYSIQQNADIMAKNIVVDANGLSFDIVFNNGEIISDIHMPIYGEHNAGNALVAVAIAKFLGLNSQEIKKGLSAYNGVKQRFTKVGEFNNASIIDDYGHHPTEIKATLKGARNVVKNHKLICVFQPHKYSRVRDLFNEFANAFTDADYVIVSEIYSASQNPIEGISQDAICDAIKKTGHKNVIKLNHENDLAQILKPLLNVGDLVLCTGAGTISSWAHKLEEQLKNL
ncbi:MAG: UDP-N-acetylmuramate--L-alanine ligase [Alphaproteobacteria bacterium]